MLWHVSGNPVSHFRGKTARKSSTFYWFTITAFSSIKFRKVREKNGYPQDFLHRYPSSSGYKGLCSMTPSMNFCAPNLNLNQNPQETTACENNLWTALGTIHTFQGWEDSRNNLDSWSPRVLLLERSLKIIQSNCPCVTWGNWEPKKGHIFSKLYKVTM